jgi:hypothetical protein
METRLMGLFSGRYRRIWVQGSRLGSVCIILFPIDSSDYRIITEFRGGEITFERVRGLIEKDITD